MTDNLVKFMFKSESTETRIKYFFHYKNIIKKIENKEPLSMPWMLPHWQKGLKLLTEVMEESKRICANNSFSCPYHACMGNGCQIEKVILNNTSLGLPKCNLYFVFEKFTNL